MPVPASAEVVAVSPQQVASRPPPGLDGAAGDSAAAPLRAAAGPFLGRPPAKTLGKRLGRYQLGTPRTLWFPSGPSEARWAFKTVKSSDIPPICGLRTYAA